MCVCSLSHLRLCLQDTVKPRQGGGLSYSGVSNRAPPSSPMFSSSPAAHQLEHPNAPYEQKASLISACAHGSSVGGPGGRAGVSNAVLDH